MTPSHETVLWFQEPRETEGIHLTIRTEDGGARFAYSVDHGETWSPVLDGQHTVRKLTFDELHQFTSHVQLPRIEVLRGGSDGQAVFTVIRDQERRPEPGLLTPDYVYEKVIRFAHDALPDEQLAKPEPPPPNRKARRRAAALKRRR